MGAMWSGQGTENLGYGVRNLDSLERRPGFDFLAHGTIGGKPRGCWPRVHEDEN